MSGNADASIRYFAERGYIPAGPTRTVLLEYTIHRVSMQRLADLTSSKRYILDAVRRGRNQLVHRDLAAALDNLPFDDVVDRYGTPEPYVDDVIVDRLLAGVPVDIAPHDKPEYARRLHTVHGWNKSRTAAALGINGTRINRILAQEPAA